MDDGRSRSSPRKIGRYVIEAELGAGGMGVVYRALDPLLNRHVALKVLLSEPSHDSATHAEWSARMLGEARAAAAFSHPNVVAVYDVGVFEGAPFITMELASGKTLRRFIGDDAIALGKRVGWLIDVARALAAAHRAGIVHRDIKPENLIVTDEGDIKILDFGIAKRSSEPGAVASMAALTAAGMVLGTPQYMAPEQIRSESLDGRVDQFAWGVVAFELLTGRPMWPASTEPMRLIASILTSVTPPPRAIAPGIPEALSRIIERTVAKKRADRFPNMDAVADALEGAQGQAAVGRAAPRSRSRTSRWRVQVLLVALAALLAGAAGVGLVALSGARSRRAVQGQRPGDPRTRMAVSVLPFDNQTGRAEDNWLRVGLSDALAAKLTSAGSFDVVSQSAGATAEVASAKRLGAALVVVGSFQKIDDQIRIAARVEETEEPHSVVASSDEHGSMAQIFDLQDALAFALTEKLRPNGDMSDSAAAPPSAIRASGTRSLEAFEAFSTGRSLLAARRVPDAMRAFDRAVAADPGYRDARATLNRVRAEAHHFLIKDDGAVVETITEAIAGEPGAPWMLTTDSGTLTRAWDLDGNALPIDRVAASGNEATFRVVVGRRDHDEPRGIVYELESASKDKHAGGLSVLFHSVTKSTSGENTFLVQLPPGGHALAVIPTPEDVREDASGALLLVREVRGAFVPYAFSVVHASDALVLDRFRSATPVTRANWIASADPRMRRHGWADALAGAADVLSSCLLAKREEIDRAREIQSGIGNAGGGPEVGTAYAPFFAARAEFCVANAAHDDRAAATALETALGVDERPAPLVEEAYLDAIGWFAQRKRIGDMARLVRLEHRRAPWFREKLFHDSLPSGGEETALRQILAREPGNVAAAYDLALTLFQSKRYEEAAEALGAADEFLGGVYVAELRARIAMARGQEKEAVDDLRKLSTYYPMTWAWTAHAVLLASAGRGDLALSLVADQAPRTEYDPPVFWALRYVVGVLSHASRYAGRIVDIVGRAKETQYGEPYRLERMIDLIEVASLSMDPDGRVLSRMLFEKLQAMVQGESPDACGEACLKKLGEHVCRVRNLATAERAWIAKTLGPSCEP